jgi:hypothetical protein
MVVNQVNLCLRHVIWSVSQRGCLAMHSLGVFPSSRVPPVFTAAAQDYTLPPQEFVPMEHMAEDDELVYPVLSSPPTRRFTRALVGYKSLSFEGFLACV